MINVLLNKIFGSKNERELKRLQPLVAEISAKEPSLARLSDLDLRAKADEFKKRLADGATLDDILTDAFAVCREMAKRKLEMRHFDVQLIGGMVLHEGKISEMKTGEGKTLVATLALYLNALEGKGAHLVTVNDYLAKRDAQWMGPLYHNLGLSVGVIQHEASFLYDPTYEAEDKRLQHLRPCTRQEAYRADITYGTNNEFGFDYLRDNMVGDLADCVQRELHYAIVDEVDSILIDEARTPLIISGPTEDSTDLYYRIDRIIPMLKRDVDYTIEEKTRTAALTEEGNEKVERALGVTNLYDLANMDLVHHVVQGLRAHAMYHRDVDYVVKDGEVIIVDEFTGRLMPGRRWSDGLHQAVEAKEGVAVREESQTLATITIQNYFRMYEKLSGMTGTAETEETQFSEIYKLVVLGIPTKRPVRGTDIKLGTGVKKCQVCGIKSREAPFGQLVEKPDLTPHQIKELTCNEDPPCGLVIVGTERHEARRIDRQLRGRSGRQGDPGQSVFFLSLEDDLMRLFGSDRIARWMDRTGAEEGEVITHPWVTSAIGQAQKRVELQNFQARKKLLEYDDVMNQQREVIYSLRLFALEGGEELKAEAQSMVDAAMERLVDVVIAEQDDPFQWDWDLITSEFLQKFLLSLPPVADRAKLRSREDLVRAVQQAGRAAFRGKLDYFQEIEQQVGATKLGEQALSHVMLSVIDEKWKDHLYDLDQLRAAIQYRAWGQKDPLIEYKQEAYEMFVGLRSEERRVGKECRSRWSPYH